MTITTSSTPRCDTVRHRGHPLELIPLFRRWPPSVPRNLLYTAIWSSLIAIVVALVQHLLATYWKISFGRMLFYTLVISNVVGYLIHGALHLLERYLPRSENLWPFRIAQLVAVCLASVVGVALGNTLLHGRNPLLMFQHRFSLTILLGVGATTASIMVIVLAVGERRMRQATERARQQEQIAAAGRLIAEARLRALQAQIEPHFLYNTLANVVSLIDTQPAKARRMLERFIDYLRASLSASRAEHATVGGELALASAYLDVLGVRMEQRLRWRFALDPAVASLPVAPMLLQPLVENAIMHGIEPKLDGGEIVVSARLHEGLLCIEVADTGLGLREAAPRPGGGVGLSNLRERLQQLYAGAARLQLIENPAGGVTARLLLPLHTVPSSTIPTP
ncbi:sensor histidine kinase [Massilia yuzhufengensis]|uniref:Sensor histidine kinase YesM n=1 Tax=Massilia yuzhufengensis TaxID=1164594 RepID=A0A1I1I4H4_9BURK|nr:histidine kinase [Massilia yuzhufengensis]SFC30712.1 Sensor histidine kinase YesM [Massilia yuzhufengensis]